MDIAIINVGNEVLEGDTLNTNSQFLSKEISFLGGNISFHIVCKDNKEDIIDILSFFSEKVDLIVLTGGLGPTKDDLTKETVAEFLNLKLLLDKDTLENIKEKFKKFKKVMTDNNIKQANLIEGATKLLNDKGTAPGFIIENKLCDYCLLPGPPRELKPMFNKFVKKYLNKKLSNNETYFKYIKIADLGESYVENQLLKFYSIQDIYIGTYASIGEVKIKVSSTNILKLAKVFKELFEKFKKNIVSVDTEDTYSSVCNYLIENKVTISTAESCTGGMVASKIVNKPGISSIYSGSIIAYSNKMKCDYLLVKKETLDKYGAVSEEVVKEMVIGLYEKISSDICIAITGVAGPNGGTKEKPVGLVYIAIKIFGDVFIYKNNFRGNRYEIRKRTTKKIFNEISRKILFDKLAE